MAGMSSVTLVARAGALVLGRRDGNVSDDSRARLRIQFETATRQ
jgi:hypothetical protein